MGTSRFGPKAVLGERVQRFAEMALGCGEGPTGPFDTPQGPLGYANANPILSLLRTGQSLQNLGTRLLDPSLDGIGFSQPGGKPAPGLPVPAKVLDSLL
jgi:hypothetical protein